ncbi:MAG TPA: ABC transporter permease subunit, partial [Euzebya sp.]|nr:ABC transporter permease subunit [Euzebya sp.]
MRAASPADPSTHDAPPPGAADPGPDPRVRGLPLRVLGLVAGLVFAAPLIFLLQQAVSFGAPFRRALGDPANLPPLGRSLLLAGTVAAATAVLGTACAWVVTRTELPLARAWAVLLALPLVLPSYIGAFTLQAALSRGGLTDRVLGLSLPSVEGFWAAFAIMTLLTYPYVFLLVAARLRQLPAALEESARLLGHRPPAIVRTVVLPQVLPAVAAGGLLVFLYVVSDFGAVQLLRYDTLTRVIFGNLLDRPLSSALALQLGVVALVIAGGERAALARVRRTVGAVAVRGHAGLRYPLGRWRLPA